MLIRATAFLFMGVLVYVLSIGPVGLYSKGLPQKQGAMLRCIYAPLIWLARDTVYGRPIVVYAMWWENLGREK